MQTRKIERGERSTPAPFSMAQMEIRGGASVAFQFLGRQDNSVPPPPGERCLLHSHAYYEVIFVRKGEFAQHLENGVFHYKAGDVIFLNRNVRHREGYECDCALTFLNFSLPFVEELFQSSAGQLVPCVLQYSKGPIFKFLQENGKVSDNHFRKEYLDFFAYGQPEQVFSQLDAIAEELTCPSTGYGFRIQGRLLELCKNLEDPKMYLLSHIRVDARTDEFLCSRVIRYLETHHGRATREELGSFFHYNGDYLNHVVKRCTGMTIAQLGQQICLREAQALLRDTNLGISMIITQLGFSNRTYFYRIFREATGMTPYQFRKKSVEETFLSL